MHSCPAQFSKILMDRRGFILSFVGTAILPWKYSIAAPSSSRPKRIVLIGGPKSHGPGEHDFPRAIARLEYLLKRADPLREAQIAAFPEGFPEDLSRLDGASTLVLYFDGVQRPPAPLLDPSRIRAMQRLMDEGVGLICLHQASTVPKGNTTIPMEEWLGAKRDGMFDRTTEMASFTPITLASPICSGLEPFTYEDEFYPTLIKSAETTNLTPILTAQLHIAFREGKPIREHKANPYTVAWAFERRNGGRSFGFTGCHYLKSFDQPQIQKMLLNAICWTSGLAVPSEGVTVASG